MLTASHFTDDSAKYSLLCKDTRMYMNVAIWMIEK